MTIEYKFKILNVDEKNRCMEVEYTAKGLPTHIKGVRLPREGESLEALIDSFSPIPEWDYLLATVKVPEVMEGTIYPTQPNVNYKLEPKATDIDLPTVIFE